MLQMIQVLIAIILFVIMNETGSTFYKYSFLHSLLIQEQILGGFLSAMNSFCSEFLTGPLDRAKIGDNFIIFTRNPPFVMAYFFKGNTYLAQHKIKNFVKAFNENHFQAKEILSYSLEHTCVVNKEDEQNITNLLLNSFHFEKTT